MTKSKNENALFGLVATIAMHCPNQGVPALRKGSAQVFSIDLLTFASSRCPLLAILSLFNTSSKLSNRKLSQESNFYLFSHFVKTVNFSRRATPIFFHTSFKTLTFSGEQLLSFFTLRSKVNFSRRATPI